jgi:hypothetical protein
MPRPKDETYIIDICDHLLELKAARGHRFGFLRGDPGRAGIRLPLPVDAYYAEISLVVEYHERQHCQEVGFFDKRIVASGLHVESNGGNMTYAVGKYFHKTGSLSWSSATTNLSTTLVSA